MRYRDIVAVFSVRRYWYRSMELTISLRRNIMQ